MCRPIDTCIHKRGKVNTTFKGGGQVVSMVCSGTAVRVQVSVMKYLICHMLRHFINFNLSVVHYEKQISKNKQDVRKSSQHTRILRYLVTSPIRKATIAFKLVSVSRLERGCGCYDLTIRRRSLGLAQL